MFNKILNRIKEIRNSRLLPCLAFAVLLISANGVFYSLTDTASPIIWILSAALYTVLTLLYLNSQKNSDDGEDILIENESFLSKMSADLIAKTASPISICNNSGKIIWHNVAFSTYFGKKNISGNKFDSLAGFSFNDIKDNSLDYSEVPISIDDSFYNIRCFPVSYKNKRYYMTVWEDRTALVNTQQKLADEDTVVAYVIADNLEELAQHAKESSRISATNLENILKEWANSVGGIIKEYQNNRYVFIFRAAEMKSFIEKKFDILDRIREIRIGESSFSVTVSMGISQISGSLSEKERVAAEALDMALQRGGDQVVVKTAKGLEFFGGKLQTVQKRTKVRARVFANELASIISKSSNVIIMGHKAIDFDCIGACIGIARLVAFCGIHFNIVCNEKDPNFIKCFERIKNLELYKDKSVFINSADAQDLMQSETLVVIVDVNNKNQLEAPSIAEISHRTVYIDHHRKTAEFDEAPLISYIEPSASSACELVAEILEQALPSGTLLKEEADIMYSGILLDTKQFTHNSGVKTFGAALFLRGEGAIPSDAQTLFKSCLDDFISEAKFESNVVIYKKCIAISLNDNNSNTPSDRIAAAKAADKLLTVEGVKASFALCKIDDKIHISARSLGEINVQLILEKLEGGGHFDSAATQLAGNITEVLERLKSAIDEYLS